MVLKTIKTIFFLSFFFGCQAQVVDCCEVLQETYPNYTDLYIFAGQSNMGRSLTAEMSTNQATNYDITVSNTKIHNGRVSASFVDMNVGQTTYLDNTGEFGAEASFFKLIQDYKPKERYLIKYGVGNTELYTYWSPGGTGYTALITNVGDAIAEMAAAGKYPRLAFFYWMQGENDATNLTWANDYETKLGNFFTEFRQDFDSIMVANGFQVKWKWPVIIGKINAPATDYRATVRTAQENYCFNTSNYAIIVHTDALPLRDAVHYSATGQITLGAELFRMFKDY